MTAGHHRRIVGVVCPAGDDSPLDEPRQDIASDSFVGLVQPELRYQFLCVLTQPRHGARQLFEP
jgi:hypothetical protein